MTISLQLPIISNSVCSAAMSAFVPPPGYTLPPLGVPPITKEMLCAGGEAFRSACKVTITSGLLRGRLTGG